MASLSSNGVLDKGWQNVGVNFSDVASMANVAKGYMDNVNDLFNNYQNRQLEDEKNYISKLSLLEGIRQFNENNKYNRDKLAQDLSIEQAKIQNEWNKLKYTEELQAKEAKAQSDASYITSGQMLEDLQKSYQNDLNNNKERIAALNNVNSLTQQVNDLVKKQGNYDTDITNLKNGGNTKARQFKDYMKQVNDFRNMVDHIDDMNNGQGPTAQDQAYIESEQQRLRELGSQYGVEEDPVNKRFIFGWNDNGMNKILNRLNSQPLDTNSITQISNLEAQKKQDLATIDVLTKRLDEAKANQKRIEDSIFAPYKDQMVTAQRPFTIKTDSNGVPIRENNWMEQERILQEMYNRVGLPYNPNNNNGSISRDMMKFGMTMAQELAKNNAERQNKLTELRNKHNIELNGLTPTQMIQKSNKNFKWTRASHETMFNDTVGAIFNFLDNAGYKNKYDKARLASTALSSFATSEWFMGSDYRYKVFGLDTGSDGISHSDSAAILNTFLSLDPNKINQQQLNSALLTLPQGLRAAVIDILNK